MGIGFSFMPIQVVKAAASLSFECWFFPRDQLHHILYCSLSVGGELCFMIDNYHYWSLKIISAKKSKPRPWERGGIFYTDDFCPTILNCTSKDLYTRVSCNYFQWQPAQTRKTKDDDCWLSVGTKEDAGDGVDDRRFSEAFARGAFFLQTKFHINCISLHCNQYGSLCW